MTEKNSKTATEMASELVDNVLPGTSAYRNQVTLGLVSVVRAVVREELKEQRVMRYTAHYGGPGCLPKDES